MFSSTVAASPPGPAVRRPLQPSATMASAGAWAPPPDSPESAATGTGSPTLREDRAPAAKSHPTGTTVRGTPRTARHGPACPASAPVCAARVPGRRIPESSACLRQHAFQLFLGLEQPGLGCPLRDLENGRDLDRKSTRLNSSHLVI